MPTLIERPQTEREMHNGRKIKRVVHDRNSPPPDMIFQPGLHQVVGNIAKGVIEEMRKNVGEHYQAGDEADLTHANAMHPRRKRGVHAGADVTDSGGLGSHAEPSFEKWLDRLANEHESRASTIRITFRAW